jgi:hypothetical protein
MYIFILMSVILSTRFHLVCLCDAVYGLSFGYLNQFLMFIRLFAVFLATPQESD